MIVSSGVQKRGFYEHTLNQKKKRSVTLKRLGYHTGNKLTGGVNQ